MLKEIWLKDETKIKVNGRTVQGRDPVKLLWTGSSVELTVKGSSLELLLEGSYALHEIWVAIEINGEILSRRVVSRDREWICVYRNKLPDKVTKVKIIKEVQAMGEDAEHCLKLYAVRTDGEILPPDPVKMRIEYIGDSITSGEGTIGAKSEDEWISMYFSHVRSYPYMVSKVLESDYRVFSQSGWGVYHSWDNDPKCAIPLYYEQICSVMSGESFVKDGFHEANDFRAWQPDFICVNLGTNDDGAFHNPPRRDPEMGEITKLHMVGETIGEDFYEPGTAYEEKDLEKVKNAAKKFLYTLRRCNPKAYILWCFGILSDNMAAAIKPAIAEYQQESKDDRVEYLPIPEVTEETIGARMHPGVEAHRLAAEVIAARIKELRG